jgi:apolipoprotein N-acyltransferase
MAQMRAIENGVSVVRVADNGLSAVYDPYGRSLATMDHAHHDGSTTGERVIIAQVPTHGTTTVYPIIGDLFGWLAAAGFVALIVYGIVLGRRARAAEATAKAPGEEDLAPAN